MRRRDSHATLAWWGARTQRAPGPVAPHATARQPYRATPPGAAAVGLESRRGSLSSSFSISSSPRPDAPAGRTAAGSRPPIPAPNLLIWGGKSGINHSPRPCEGIPLLLPLLPLHYVDRRRFWWPRVSSSILRFRRNAILFNVNDDYFILSSISTRVIDV
jgi:hypothetical protein